MQGHTFILKPEDIENKSFEIIERLLESRELNPRHLPVVKRVIHTTADLEYAELLKISDTAVQKGIDALQSGCCVVTDTRMAEAGINKKALAGLRASVRCYMDDEAVAAEALSRGITRAAVSMERAAADPASRIFVIGNAPTALLRLYELISEGAVKPELVIGVPVGFVNVAEAKELIRQCGVPYIVSEGQKGGSNVAAAIVNALMLMAGEKKTDDYVTVGGRRLRKGYTTGTCAAAAAKAAAYMLVSGKVPDKVRVEIPSGARLELPLSDMLLGENFAECSVVKDGGDDPDVTTGLKIFARVELTGDGRISVEAGRGIGRVTLPGLKVEVGKPAINPVPMEMIARSVSEVLPEGKGAVITLSVPGGEEAAKKTYNPKLGIVGGISIIGTKGIVEPMSEEAWKEALALELNVLRNKGCSSCVFVFGNYGEDFAVNSLGVRKDRIIKIGNFVGYMLDRAAEYGFEGVLLIGHLGKLVKVAAGIFHTHSRTADARREILTAYAGLEGAFQEVLRRIYACRTTGEAALIIESEGLAGIYERIARNASERCGDYTYDKVKIGIALFNESNRLLHMDGRAEEIVMKLKNSGE